MLNIWKIFPVPIKTKVVSCSLSIAGEILKLVTSKLNVTFSFVLHFVFFFVSFRGWGGGRGRVVVTEGWNY